MRLIPLYRCDKFAIVSDEDFEELSKFRWHAKPVGPSIFYARRSITGASPTYMHQDIMGRPPSQFLTIDHINRDPLDNRRENLRFATKTTQSANVRLGPRKFPELVGLRGAQRRQYGKCIRYFACINKGGNRRRGMLRSSPIEAAFDYDRMAIEWRGDTAALNFPCLKPAWIIERMANG